MEYCSTCSSPLVSSPPSSSKTPQDRRVQCCSRVICGKCIQANPRFATTCPYCQVSSSPSLLPQGLRDPPPYTSLPNSRSKTLAASSSSPPPYQEIEQEGGKKEKGDDTLHFLDHEHDTVHSLSLRYGVPAHALRRLNNITSDHLLQARRTVLIPAEHYGGGSLSPRPVEGEDEERRRGQIRRFMKTCKVHDYDVALFYLEQAGYDLQDAVTACSQDDAWEREHPNVRKARVPFWST